MGRKCRLFAAAAFLAAVASAEGDDREAIEKALFSDDPVERNRAFWKIHTLPKEQAVQLYARAFESVDPSLRMMAPDQLRRYKPHAEKLLPGLIQLLYDENDRVAHGSALLLTELGPAAAPALPYLRDIQGRPMVGGFAKKIVEALPSQTQVEPLGAWKKANPKASLLDALTSEDWRVRGRAARESKGSGAEALAALEKACADPKPYVRMKAARALAGSGAAGHAHLVNVLKTGAPRARRLAAYAFSWEKGGYKEVVPDLLAALESKDPPLVQAASHALARLGPDAKEAVPSLIQLLDDDRTVMGAAQILSGVGPDAKAAVPALVGVLESARFSSARTGAAHALGRIGDPRAVPVLKRYVSGERNPYEATMALIALGDPGHEALLEIFRSDSKSRFYVLHRLGAAAFESNAFRTMVDEGLTDENPRIRSACGNYLRRLPTKTPASVAALLAALRTETREDARASIAHNLARLAEVDDLLPLLADADPNLRMAGIVALRGSEAKDRGRALPALGKRLADEHRLVRWRAVEAVATFPPKDALPLLSPRLRAETDPMIRRSAAASLGAMRSKGVQTLVRALDDESEQVRVAALYGLAASGSALRDALPVLTHIVAEPKSSMSYPAARLLVRLPEGRVVLAESLIDDRDKVRPHVVSALSREGGEEGVDVLIGALLTERGYRSAIVRGLSDPGAAAKVHALMEEGNDERNVRIMAILRRLGARGTAFLIEHAENDKGAVRTAAVEALLGMRSPQAIPALVPMLADDDPAIRALVARQLPRFLPRSTPAFLEVLPDAPDREAVAGILVRYSRHAVPFLTQALKSPRLEVRRDAAWILGRIGPWSRLAVPSLVEALQEDAVALQVIEALAAIGQGSLEALPELKERAKEEQFSEAASEAIRRIKAAKQ